MGDPVLAHATYGGSEKSSTLYHGSHVRTRPFMGSRGLLTLPAFLPADAESAAAHSVQEKLAEEKRTSTGPLLCPDLNFLALKQQSNAHD